MRENQEGSAATVNYKKLIDKRARVFEIVLILLLIGVCSLALRLGTPDVDFQYHIHTLWCWLCNKGAFLTQAQTAILSKTWAARIIAAGLAGSALALAGASYQSAFQNVLISPDILGAAAGAGIGACLGTLMHAPIILTGLLCFGTSLCAVGLTYFISKHLHHGLNMTLTLILTGIITSAFCNSIITILVAQAPAQVNLFDMGYWLTGDLSAQTEIPMLFFIPIYLICIGVLFAIRWKLNILSLENDEAQALGVNTSRMRLVCIICATALTSGVVLFAGAVGWVGLMIPNLIRLTLGPNYKNLLPLSAISGALFLVIVDTLCHVYQLPGLTLGVVTSFIGAPFFLFVLYLQRKGIPWNS